MSDTIALMVLREAFRELARKIVSGEEVEDGYEFEMTPEAMRAVDKYLEK